VAVGVAPDAARGADLAWEMAWAVDSELGWAVAPGVVPVAA
jgi:hypothetical protein